MTYYILECWGLIIHLFNYIYCSKELKFTTFFFIAYIKNHKNVQTGIYFWNLYKIRGLQSFNMDLYTCIIYLFCVCCFQAEVVCLSQTFSVSNFQIPYTCIIFNLEAIWIRKIANQNNSWMNKTIHWKINACTRGYQNASRLSL